MVKIHGMSTSGNCHKVRMVLEALGEPYQWREIDTRDGTTRTPEFLAMNPNGQVPVAEIAAGVFLPESNAIMAYLADGSALVPVDRLLRARMLQWMFFEQYSHEPYIAVARYLRRFHPDPESQRALADSRMAGDIARSGSWKVDSRKRRFWSGTATASPISRSTPIRMSRATVGSILRAFPPSGHGSLASKRSPATRA